MPACCPAVERKSDIGGDHDYSCSLRRHHGGGNRTHPNIQSARADDYPSRQVTMIVPWAPAGAVEPRHASSRRSCGAARQTVMIENRGGAGSTLWHRDRGQGGAGRLHARHAGQRLDGDRIRDVQAVALRPDQGFRADGADRPRAVRADRQQGAGDQDRAGPHRLREGEQDLLCVGRAGLAASHLCRDVQGHDRHRDDACALQGQRRRHQGRGGGPRAGDVLRSGAVAAAGRERHGAGAWRHDS